ncbi:hypothetical protein O4H52_03040 [Sphingomonadaceae bacterium G21617-S1]|nr:hypothetical protein [Sphingomonadaceae bacterium G21617-S1]
MTKIPPRFGVNGDVTMYAGEVFPIELQLQPTLEADAVDLTGRTFVMSAYEGLTGTEVMSVSAEAADDANSVVLAFVGDDTAALFTASLATQLRLALVELVDGGVKLLGDGLLLLCRLPTFAGAAPSPAPDAPYIGVTIVQASNRVQFVERGTPASIALGTVTTGVPGSDAAIEMVGPRWARTVNFTIPGTDLDSIGYPDGAVPAYAMRIALADAGRLYDIASNIDADLGSVVNIRWGSGAPIVPGDPMAAFIQTTLDYSDPEMVDLFTAAAAAI